ncbi:MAG: tyrosine--tRNA ligase [Mycoplasmatales bacterium]
MNVYDILNDKGLIKDVTDSEIKNRLKRPISLYCGFDPTADSLHVGHLLPIMLLKNFEVKGHTPIILVGGATGCIGDPSFKKDERKLSSLETVQAYSKSLEKQLSQYFDNAVFLNNYEWISKIDTITFLRDYGKAFSINNMIAKEAVSSRMDTGLSFTEFSYPILQALDFKHLAEHHNCELQIGGSDQWGNITAGTDLIRKTSDKKVYGLTVPLFTKSDGTKFGKTEGGAVWLDPLKTSPYEMYQFFLATDDNDVINCLKYFTLLDLSSIEELEQSLKEEPFKKEAHKVLAYQVTSFVHGKDNADNAIKISNMLFSGDIKDIKADDIKDNFINETIYDINDNVSILDLLITTNLASSKREAREFISNNSISINSQKITSEEDIISKDRAIDNVYLLIKRGKKNYAFAMFN